MGGGLFFSGTFFSAREGRDPLQSTIQRKAPCIRQRPQQRPSDSSSETYPMITIINTKFLIANPPSTPRKTNYTTHHVFIHLCYAFGTFTCKTAYLMGGNLYGTTAVPLWRPETSLEPLVTILDFNVKILDLDIKDLCIF